MEKRDGELVSLATQLGMEGFRQTPFSVETVRRFLSQCGKRVREQEDSTRQEKVRDYHNSVRCDITHYALYGFWTDAVAWLKFTSLLLTFLFLFCA